MIGLFVKRPQMRRPRSRGALIVIALLLFGSAMIRLGGGTGQALAEAAALGTPEGETGGQKAEICTRAAEMQPVIDAMNRRKAWLDEQETALRDRKQTLKIADEEIAGKMAALVAAEEQLRQTIALADTAAEDDLARLTKVYENMKPREAAALFEQMDPVFAAGFLGRMRPEAAAGIMAGLSPEAAHGFSVVLAGRNADIPEN